MRSFLLLAALIAVTRSTVPPSETGPMQAHWSSVYTITGAADTMAPTLASFEFDDDITSWNITDWNKGDTFQVEFNFILRDASIPYITSSSIDVYGQAGCWVRWIRSEGNEFVSADYFQMNAPEYGDLDGHLTPHDAYGAFSIHPGLMPGTWVPYITCNDIFLNQATFASQSAAITIVNLKVDVTAPTIANDFTFEGPTTFTFTNDVDSYEAAMAVTVTDDLSGVETVVFVVGMPDGTEMELTGSLPYGAGDDYSLYQAGIGFYRDDALAGTYTIKRVVAVDWAGNMTTLALTGRTITLLWDVSAELASCSNVTFLGIEAIHNNVGQSPMVWIELDCTIPVAYYGMYLNAAVTFKHAASGVTQPGTLTFMASDDVAMVRSGFFANCPIGDWTLQTLTINLPSGGKTTYDADFVEPVESSSTADASTADGQSSTAGGEESSTGDDPSSGSRSSVGAGTVLVAALAVVYAL